MRVKNISKYMKNKRRKIEVISHNCSYAQYKYIQSEIQINVSNIKRKNRQKILHDNMMAQRYKLKFIF